MKNLLTIFIVSISLSGFSQVKISTTNYSEYLVSGGGNISNSESKRSKAYFLVSADMSTMKVKSKFRHINGRHKCKIEVSRADNGVISVYLSANIKGENYLFCLSGDKKSVIVSLVSGGGSVMMFN